MTTVSIDGDHLVVTMHGTHKIATLRSEITIPLSHIRGVTADPTVAEDYPTTLEKRLGTNLYRTYYGGRFLQDGVRVFWDVHRPEKAIVITVVDDEFDRIIVEVADPQGATNMIRNAIGLPRPRSVDDRRVPLGHGRRVDGVRSVPPSRDLGAGPVDPAVLEGGEP